jgi:ribosomal protein L36
MGLRKYKLIHNTQIDKIKTVTAENQIIKRQKRVYILKLVFSKVVRNVKP